MFPVECGHLFSYLVEFHHRIVALFLRAVPATKETILERADFTIQLLMFVDADKERRMFIFFFIFIFCQLLSLQI